MSHLLNSRKKYYRVIKKIDDEKNRDKEIGYAKYIQYIFLIGGFILKF